MERKFKAFNNNKIIVITPDELTEETMIVPLFCPVCKFPMKTREDAAAFRGVQCCEKCNNRWSGVPNIFWKSQETWPNKLYPEDWKEYINERVKLSRPIINIK